MKNESTKTKSIDRTTGKNLEQRFDRGENVLDYFDTGKAQVMESLSVQRVNVDLPQWTITALDQEAARIGISRQAVIKTWLVERLDSHRKKAV